MTDRLDAELLRRRVLQINGELTDQAASRWSAALMMFDAESDDPVEIQVSAHGGSPAGLLALLDTIDLMGVPVRATAMGGVSDAAAIFLALCPWRRASPSARLRLELPTTSAAGSPSDLVRLVEEARALETDLLDRLQARCHLSVVELETALRRGRSFSATEAQAAGLVDEVGVGTTPRPPGPRSLPS